MRSLVSNQFRVLLYVAFLFGLCSIYATNNARFWSNINSVSGIKPEQFVYLITHLVLPP